MSDQMAVERARSVKQAHEEELMVMPNVVAIGIGRRKVGGSFSNEIAIIVSVSQKYLPDELDEADTIPTEIEGVLVDVQQVGTLRAGG